jgi:hypothetical protein
MGFDFMQLGWVVGQTVIVRPAHIPLIDLVEGRFQRLMGASRCQCLDFIHRRLQGFMRYRNRPVDHGKGFQESGFLNQLAYVRLFHSLLQSTFVNLARLIRSLFTTQIVNRSSQPDLSPPVSNQRPWPLTCSALHL